MTATLRGGRITVGAESRSNSGLYRSGAAAETSSSSSSSSEHGPRSPERAVEGRTPMSRSHKPSVFQVGKVRDDGHTVVISGWGLGLCAAGLLLPPAPVRRQPRHRRGPGRWPARPRQLRRRWLRLLRGVDRRRAVRDPPRLPDRRRPPGPGAPRRLTTAAPDGPSGRAPSPGLRPRVRGARRCRPGRRRGGAADGARCDGRSWAVGQRTTGAAPSQPARRRLRVDTASLRSVSTRNERCPSPAPAQLIGGRRCSPPARPRVAVPGPSLAVGAALVAAADGAARAVPGRAPRRAPPPRPAS